MLDLVLRPIKERLFAPVARAVGSRVSPLAVTLAGLVVGLGAAVLVARAAYVAGLVCWLANRLLDGLDGTLARSQGASSDFGGYVDIVVDFVVYATIPIAFVLAVPTVATSLAALSLLACFYVNAASWMYLAAILERRDAGARSRDELTTITMPEGLVGGTETVLLYTTFFLWPERVAPLFLLVAALVLATVCQRIAWAARRL